MSRSNVRAGSRAMGRGLESLCLLGVIAFGVGSCAPMTRGTRSRLESSARATRQTGPSEQLTPIGIETAPTPDADALVREALRGTSSEPETHLSARMQIRPLSIPHPVAGGNARFNFDGGRRGWITAAPSPELLATPAFANGRIYVGGGFASHEFYALDAYSGELAWSVAAPDGGPSAAIVKDRRVIFNTESCTLFVVDADTGHMIWHRWLGDPLMSQPAAEGDYVYSAYPTNGSHAFGAFRLRDGEPGWHQPIPADVIQAPHIHGEGIFFATMDGTVTRLDRATGRVVWQRAIGAASAPWVDGDHVLITRRVERSRGPGEQAIVLSARDGALASEGDTFDAPYLTGESRDRQLARGQQGAWGSVPHGEHLGLRNVAAGWAFQGSTPSVSDGRAYFAIGGEIRARDMASGRTVWRRSYAEANGAQAISPPAVVGSQLVFGTVDGRVYAVDIDTGMTLWGYDVGEPIVFQPIVANGWVYVSTGRGHVIGLEVGDARFDGWHMWGGNAAHDGLVESAGEVDPRLIASLERPSQGSMRVAHFENTSSGAPADPNAPRGAHAVVSAPAEGAAGASSAPSGERPEQPDLPLSHTSVNARVSGTVARVTVTQQFQNRFAQPIEAVYLFPLPADAAVDAMEMHIGERVVRARIQRRAEAQHTYTQARTEGRRAALLEQQRPNLFAQRVANIQPGERIDVLIQYVQSLPFADGAYEFAFPMVAPRRYDPSHPDPNAAHDPLAPHRGEPAALAAAGNSMRSARDIDVSVHLDPGLPIEAIDSPSHALAVTRDGADRAEIGLATGDTIANRDLVIHYRVGGAVPRAAVLPYHDAESGYVGLIVQPPDAPAVASLAPRDLVCVIDTSSSMNGRPLEQARGVLDRVLSDLRPGDTFQLIRFSDRVERLDPHSLAVNEANVTRGHEFVRTLRATGATEMVAAIRVALEASHANSDPARLPIVLLVTDGFIGNEADVLRALAENLGRTRVYALGVGSSVNRFLLERAAEIGRGRAIVSTLGESPEDAARRFAGYVARPVFTDVAIDWGGLDVQDTYPRHLPDLFADRPLEVHARYARGGHATVRVRGTMAGRRYERAIEVDLPNGPSDSAHEPQRALWAQAAVHDRMNALTLRDDEHLIEEVTQLGLAHHLVTPWTSFVAVDDAPARAAHVPTPGSSSGRPNDPTDSQAEVPQQATITPGRALPGDPEIRIPAPEDARAVTVVLPFGETLSAQWEPRLGLWTARFLIPRDAPEGTHPVRVIVTFADGHVETRSVWYTVDSSAPLVRLEVVGDPRPGREVTLRATQTLTRGDRLLSGPFAIRGGAIEILDDARRVEVRTPEGQVIDLAQTVPGTWEGTWRVPVTSSGRTVLHVVAVDLAANVREQNVPIEVHP